MSVAGRVADDVGVGGRRSGDLADGAASGTTSIAGRAGGIADNLDDVADDIPTRAAAHPAGPAIPPTLADPPSPPRLPESPGGRVPSHPCLTCPTRLRSSERLQRLTPQRRQAVPHMRRRAGRCCASDGCSADRRIPRAARAGSGRCAVRSSSIRADAIRQLGANQLGTHSLKPCAGSNAGRSATCACVSSARRGSESAASIRDQKDRLFHMPPAAEAIKLVTAGAAATRDVVMRGFLTPRRIGRRTTWHVGDGDAVRKASDVFPDASDYGDLTQEQFTREFISEEIFDIPMRMTPPSPMQYWEPFKL